MSTDEAVDIERRVRERLADVYTPEGAEMWLNAGNLNLHGLRPSYLLGYSNEGARRVLAEAERVAGAM